MNVTRPLSRDIGIQCLGKNFIAKTLLARRCYVYKIYTINDVDHKLADTPQQSKQMYILNQPLFH